MSALATDDGNRFGNALRAWRTSRNMSQLELAVVADVSQRHISFLETGRSQPSREMVAHLAGVLDIPLRDRNTLLDSAGFAALYSEGALDDPEMEHLRTILDQILTAYMPHPTIVVDRSWEIGLANAAAMQLSMMLCDPDVPDDVVTNAIKLTCHPLGWKPHILDWATAASNLVFQLQQELHHRPGNTALAALIEEISTYPDMDQLPIRAPLPTINDMVIPVSVRLGDDILSLFTTVTSIGSPATVLLDELRLETLLPADPESAAALHELVRNL